MYECNLNKSIQLQSRHCVQVLVYRDLKRLRCTIRKLAEGLFADSSSIWVWRSVLDAIQNMRHCDFDLTPCLHLVINTGA